MHQQLALAGFLITAACSTAGPSRIHQDRMAYNEAIVQTDSEQLLLNLVRLRYRDQPFFLQISSVSTQFQWTLSGSAGANLADGSDVDSLDLGIGGSAVTRPTMTYLPLHGDKFVEQLLSPISLEHLVLMYHSGWSIKRIMLACVQRMNGLANAPGASGPTPETVPPFAEYAEAVESLRSLQKQGALEFGAYLNGDAPALRMLVHDRPQTQDTIRRFCEQLGLREATNRFDLVWADALQPNAERVVLNSRSMLGVLFFLSQSVEVPTDHEERGLVTVTRNPDGSPFTWSEITGDLIRIHAAAERPPAAAVAVPYRGAWFYIADDDLESKSTFSMVGQLLALQAGGVSVQAPLLTLPVGS